MRRRRFLETLGAGALGALGASLAAPGLARSTSGAAPFPRIGGRATSRAEGRGPGFLFVITAYGGADLTDSFLPVATSEVSSPELADTLRVYPDELIVQPPGSAFRCVRNLSGEAPTGLPFRGGDFELSEFVTRHGDDMSVVTVENTSVNHVVAQGRSMTGDAIDGGRTITEAVAEAFGESQLLPNCNMSNSGFVIDGAREDTPDYARAVRVADARRFALGTHSFRGVSGAPASGQLARAREARRQLESLSPLETSGASALRSRYRSIREQLVPRLEDADLIANLLLLSDDPSEGGLTDAELEPLGLARSPEFGRLRAVFPGLGTDDLQAQASLAFLLAKYGVTSSVAFGLDVSPHIIDGQARDVLGSPVAFDFAHSNHVLAQNINWTRMMAMVDGLISLLKSEPHGDGSMWDQSVIYIATDFGRTKDRPAGSGLWSYGTAHDLNNGVVLLSPRIRGNRVYGGIDPDTLLTYGYDPSTGDPVPGSHMTTGHVYSLVCQALGVDFSGRHDMSGLLR